VAGADGGRANSRVNRSSGGGFAAQSDGGGGPRAGGASISTDTRLVEDRRRAGLACLGAWLLVSTSVCTFFFCFSVAVGKRVAALYHNPARFFASVPFIIIGQRTGSLRYGPVSSKMMP